VAYLASEPWMLPYVVVHQQQISTFEVGTNRFIDASDRFYRNPSTSPFFVGLCRGCNSMKSAAIENEKVEISICLWQIKEILSPVAVRNVSGRSWKYRGKRNYSVIWSSFAIISSRVYIVVPHCAD
jgi:hypothetical protein